MTISLPKVPRGRFFQMGYVCNDLEVALRSFGCDQANPQFFIINVAEHLNSPDAPVNRIALANLGGLNIEIIEVNGDAPPFYSDALNLDGSPGFHHVCYLLNDECAWREMVTEVESLGGPAMQGEMEGMMKYLYLDRRSELGHSLEYIFLEDGGRALFANVPSNHLCAAG